MLLSIGGMCDGQKDVHVDAHMDELWNISMVGVWNVDQNNTSVVAKVCDIEDGKFVNPHYIFLMVGGQPTSGNISRWESKKSSGEVVENTTIINLPSGSSWNGRKQHLCWLNVTVSGDFEETSFFFDNTTIDTYGGGEA